MGYILPLFYIYKKVRRSGKAIVKKVSGDVDLGVKYISQYRSCINVFLFFYVYEKLRRILDGVVANVLDCDVVSEFELQSCDYIHFRTNTLGKGMNSLIPPQQLVKY